MKKKLSLIILIGLILILSACGGGGTGETDDTPTEPTFKVTMHVDFLKNLLFSKYDVILKVDDDSVKTLSHGIDDDVEFEVTEGEHEIVFKSMESSAKGTVTMNVSSDIDCSYQISCYSDEVKVEEIYYDELRELAEDETKTQGTEDDFIGEKYKDIEKTLTEWGFENIKSEPVYDITFGITEPGTMENVTIDGFDSFKKGDVFKKNAEVIITYSMPEEDDPNNKTEAQEDTEAAETTEATKTTEEEKESEESTEEELPVITKKNNEDFKKLLKVKDAFDPSIKQFAEEYRGRTIRFDGCVVFMQLREGKKTRYDVALYRGDYDAENPAGPQFAFEDVSFYDMHVNGADEVTAGMNFIIEGEIWGYNEDGAYIILDPVSMTKR